MRAGTLIAGDNSEDGEVSGKLQASKGGRSGKEMAFKKRTVSGWKGHLNREPTGDEFS